MAYKKSNANGQATMANSEPVVLASDQSAVTVDLGVNNDVTVTSGAITETNSAAIKTAVEILDNAIAGTEMQVDVVAALPAGTNNIGDVDVLTVNGVAPAFGTGLRGATVQRVTIATDDSVPVTGTVTANLSATDNAVLDQIELNQDAQTALLTTIDADTGAMVTDLAAIEVLLGTIDTDTGSILTATQLLDDTVFADDAAFTLTSSKVTMAGAVRDDALSTLTAIEGDAVPLRVNSTGALHVTGGGGGTQYAVDDALGANPTGTTVLAKVDAALTAVTPVDGDAESLRVDANGALHVNMSYKLDSTNDSIAALGNVAHDAADSGSPVKIGARARNADITAVANNDRVDLLTDLLGKLLTMPYTLPENIVSGAITTAMTATTSTSLVAAPGAGLRNFITTIIVSNAHATVGTDIVIQDGSGGTTLMTIPAAAVYGGAVINLPVPLRQPTANTAIFCANVTTGASTKVSAVGYKGV